MSKTKALDSKEKIRRFRSRIKADGGAIFSLTIYPDTNRALDTHVKLSGMTKTELINYLIMRQIGPEEKAPD